MKSFNQYLGATTLFLILGISCIHFAGRYYAPIYRFDAISRTVLAPKVIDLTGILSPVKSRQMAVSGIVVHHSAFDSVYNHVPIFEMDTFHRSKGFGGFAYHYLIIQDGTIYKVRSDSECSAHAEGMNSRAIGICLLGDFNRDSVPSAQRESLKWLIREKQLLYRISDSCIYLHKSVCKTDCPGNMFRM